MKPLIPKNIPSRRTPVRNSSSSVTSAISSLGNIKKPARLKPKMIVEITPVKKSFANKKSRQVKANESEAVIHARRPPTRFAYADQTGIAGSAAIKAAPRNIDVCIPMSIFAPNKDTGSRS